ncbi:MAG: SH3 domain-containing protein [Chloroflexi bacterium]|nr:SH3 domain-containing protein [Chloroflexota bacterium]
MRRTRVILWLTLVLLTAVVSPALAAEGTRLTPSVAALNVRQGPGIGYSVIGVLYSGDDVVVTGQNRATGWYQVRLADGRTGWVSGAYAQTSGDLSQVPEVAAPVSAPGAAGAPALVQGSRIVFQTRSGGAIYVTDPDGSGLRYLTTGIDPALSPDGQWVAFTRWTGSQTGASGGLWMINVDGSGERLVMSGASQPKSPAWSPDGRQIVISMQGGGSLEPTQQCVTFGGRTFCFTQGPDPNWRLRLVDLATGSYQDLPSDPHSFGPTWDPANPWRVVYQGSQGLVALDVTLGNTWALTANPGDRAPVFSPDGSKIAVTFWQSGHWEVHVMNADGSGAVRLTQTPLDMPAQRSWNNAAPAWSPDGRQIAFLSDRNESWELWLMNADGSNQHLLLPTSALQGTPIRYDGVDERVISWK